MNLSETAFAQRLATARSSACDGSPHEAKSTSAATRRWRRPTSCGKKAIFRAGEPAIFETRSGLLTANRGPEGIELDFPAEPVHETVSDPGELAELQSALGAPVRFAGRNRFDLLVELESEELVRGLTPGYPPARAIPGARRDRHGSFQLA